MSIKTYTGVGKYRPKTDVSHLDKLRHYRKKKGNLIRPRSLIRTLVPLICSGKNLIVERPAYRNKTPNNLWVNLTRTQVPVFVSVLDDTIRENLCQSRQERKGKHWNPLSVQERP